MHGRCRTKSGRGLDRKDPTHRDCAWRHARTSPSHYRCRSLCHDGAPTLDPQGVPEDEVSPRIVLLHLRGIANSELNAIRGRRQNHMTDCRGHWHGGTVPAYRHLCNEEPASGGGAQFFLWKGHPSFKAQLHLMWFKIAQGNTETQPWRAETKQHISIVPRERMGKCRR